MIHDEPSHRPGQDPNAYAQETEAHYGERIAHYKELVDRSATVGKNPEALRSFRATLGKYEDWLKGLIERKRTERSPIDFRYAELDDVVFVDEWHANPFDDNGTRYTKRQMLDACLGDVVAAQRLTTACIERGIKSLQKAGDNHESFVYNGTREELCAAYATATIFNRVIVVHEGSRLTEFVFDNGLDHVLGDLDPIRDFDELDRQLDGLREAFREFASAVLEAKVCLVTFNPAKTWVHSDTPLLDAHSAGDSAWSDETLSVRVRTELPLDISDLALQPKLREFINEIYEPRQEVRACP